MVDSESPDDLVNAYRSLIADIYELAGLSRATSETIAQAAGGPSVAQWHVMSVATDHPVTVPDIARRLGLTRQSVQRVVNDLLDADLASLQPNPSHKRSPLVVLSRRGKRSLEAANESSYEIRYQQLTEAGVTSTEMRAARRSIRRLIAAVDS